MTSPCLLSAAWVIPITAPPIERGAVLTEGGRIVAVGSREMLRISHAGVPERELGRVALLPGLVNAHTHLSITGMTEAMRDHRGYLDWLGRVSRDSSGLTGEDVVHAVERGLEECVAAGTVLVGEITTRVEGVPVLAAHDAVHARIFFEFLGIAENRARARYALATERAASLASGPRIRPGLSPHAPYSVWPDLWRETDDLCRGNGWIWSSHVLEPEGERELIRSGTGPLRTHFDALGLWDPSFPIQGTGSLELLAECGALGPRGLLVHLVHSEPRDATLLAHFQVPVCLCPRSNAFLGLPAAPAQGLHDAGVSLCLGTDGKASNDDLSMWGEMAALASLAPELPPRVILEMATHNGAAAMGFDDRLGSLQTDREALLLAVPTEARTPAAVERALVTGGTPAGLVRIGW